MDPLSLSASISGLISLVDLIVTKAYNYVKAAKGAVAEIGKLIHELSDFYGVLSSLRLVSLRYEKELTTPTMNLQHIENCSALLEKLVGKLEKADPIRATHHSQKSEFGQKISALKQSLIWPFNAKETKSLVADVATQKMTLSLAVQVDNTNALLEALGNLKVQSNGINEIHENIVALRNEKALSRLNKKQKRIVEWVAPYDPSQRHQDVAAKLHHPNTGQLGFQEVRPNVRSVVGSPLYASASWTSRESLELMELLLDHGAEIDAVSGPHGTALMAACYCGFYDSVAYLFKKGASQKCVKIDGTEVTAMETAKNHPEIQQLLRSFKERGMEALDEPIPALTADMGKVEECIREIEEEEEAKRKAEEEEEMKEKEKVDTVNSTSDSAVPLQNQAKDITEDSGL